jgi:signal transduction histidine kinase
VRVSIEDTGTGVDGANLEQIFQPLFTTKARGNGIINVPIDH